LCGYFYGYQSYTWTATKQTRWSWAIITISTGSIENIVKVTGMVYPVQESALTFTRQGTITAIYKKIWDSVKSWDLIAEVDTTSAKLDIANAKVALSNAQNNLDKLVNWSNEVNIVQSKNALDDANAKLVLLNQQYSNLIAQRDDAISTAQNNIKALQDKASLAQNQYNYTQASVNTWTTTNNIAKDVANWNLLVKQVYTTIPETLKSIKDMILIDDKIIQDMVICEHKIQL